MKLQTDKLVSCSKDSTKNGFVCGEGERERRMQQERRCRNELKHHPIFDCVHHDAKSLKKAARVETQFTFLLHPAALRHSHCDADSQ